jgi:hypothetical protein
MLLTELSTHSYISHKLMCELYANTCIFSSKLRYVTPTLDYIFWSTNMSASFKMVFVLYCIMYLPQYIKTSLPIANFQGNTNTEYVNFV